MTVTRVWASGLLLGLLVSGGVSFNLDVNLPVIKQGQTDSFFGYSLAQHRNFKDTSQGTILVGAPRWVWHIFRNFQKFSKVSPSSFHCRDGNLQPNTTQSGALWRCPLSADWQVLCCRHLSLRPVSFNVSFHCRTARKSLLTEGDQLGPRTTVSMTAASRPLTLRFRRSSKTSSGWAWR